MSKPYVHARSSAKRFGGIPEDYMPIHQLMDSSKNGIVDSRHRVFTHNSWFISTDGPLERIFGVNIVNSDGKKVSVRDIGEQHILEDFGNRFIPTPQDYLEKLPVEDWMINGKGLPPPSMIVPEQLQKEKITQKLKNEILDRALKIEFDIDVGTDDDDINNKDILVD